LGHLPSRPNPEKSGKNLCLGKIRIDSGWLRVTRGGCESKAPPLAVRPVSQNGRSRRLVELTISVQVKGTPMGCQGKLSDFCVLGIPTISFSIKTLFTKAQPILQYCCTVVKSAIVRFGCQRDYKYSHPQIHTPLPVIVCFCRPYQQGPD